MCWDCKAARETDGQWRLFDSLKCPWCAARLIQLLGRLNIPQGESPTSWRDKISARRKVVLADAVAAGLSEAQIRDLAKGPLAVQPKGKGG